MTRPPNRFQRVAKDHYTCVPPPGFEKDPAITKALHEFDPGAIPIWRVCRWRLDGRIVNVVHHAIARYLPWPRYMRRPLGVALPMDWRGPAPNYLDKVFEDDNTLQYKQGGPGAYIPWSWPDVYYWCRFQYDKIQLGAWLARAEAKQKRLAREHEQALSELEYRKKQIEPYLERKAGEISEPEWREYLQAMAAPPGSRPSLRKKKLFSDLGARSPRPDNSPRVAPAKGVA